MFDFVHENKRAVQILLALLTLPFAIWGVNSYRQSGSDVLAKVDGVKITQQEFDDAMRQQRAQMQQMMGGRFDPAMLENPLAKQAVLEGLINRRLEVMQAHALGLAPTDAQLARMIASLPYFQRDGKFDKERYRDALRTIGMTPDAFQASVGNDLASEQLTQMYDENGYASRAAAERLIRISEQQRVVRVAHLPSEPFLAKVKVDDADIKKYYDDNQGAFRIPERARVEYVIFSAAALQPGESVSAKEIEEYYSNNPAEFTTPEQRHVLHILIAPNGGDAAAIEAARKKAEAILAEVKRSPGKFGELARKDSDDPVSAAKGGDLGFFTRGKMVKPFDEAVFSLKPGQISDLVQTQYGFHIIKLLAVKPPYTAPLKEVKGAIEQKLRMDKAETEFSQLANNFYDELQADSLKPAAALAKAQIQKSGWLQMGQRQDYPWTDKALEAVFSDDVLKKHRNSTAIEIAPDTLLAVRLADYKPAGIRPLQEVSADIRKQLQRQRAGELASKQGEALLAQLQHGGHAGLKWSAEQTVSRSTQNPAIDPELAARILQADAGKLPAYVGAENPQGGYDLVRVEKVEDAGPVDDAKLARYEAGLRAASGDELFSAVMADVRKRASISVRNFMANGKG